MCTSPTQGRPHQPISAPWLLNLALSPQLSPAAWCRDGSCPASPLLPGSPYPPQFAEEESAPETTRPFLSMHSRPRHPACTSSYCSSPDDPNTDPTEMCFKSMPFPINLEQNSDSSPSGSGPAASGPCSPGPPHSCLRAKNTRACPLQAPSPPQCLSAHGTSCHHQPHLLPPPKHPPTQDHLLLKDRGHGPRRWPPCVARGHLQGSVVTQRRRPSLWGFWSQ